MHTHSLRYLKAMEKARPYASTSMASRPTKSRQSTAHASELIKERLRKQAEQRKPQREAEALARQRAEKLDQLVEKFGRSR
jgi:ProP effector